MAWQDFIPGVNPDPYAGLADELAATLGDADALALLPYDDGTFFLKRAYFDKGLIGGLGGYETDDGDKIAVDGDGEAVRDLFGVPVLLACDPTEHAAAVDPIKALIAHKNNIGEWLRVDSKGNVVQVGPALEPAPSIATAEDVDDAFKQASNHELLASVFADYDPPDISEAEVIQRLEDTPDAELLAAIDVEVEAEEPTADELAAAVAEYEETIREYIRRLIQEEEAAKLVDAHEADIREAIREHLEQPIQVQANGMVGDGGMVGRYMQEHPDKSFDEALADLADAGEISKLYDIAPPSQVVQEGGEVKLDAATHIAVDQSKAADLLPTTWDTTEINVALDKARMEEYEEGKLMKYFVYGMVAGGVGGLVFTIILFLMFQIGGGVF